MDREGGAAPRPVRAPVTGEPSAFWAPEPWHWRPQAEQGRGGKAGCRLSSPRRGSWVRARASRGLPGGGILPASSQQRPLCPSTGATLTFSSSVENPILRSGGGGWETPPFGGLGSWGGAWVFSKWMEVETEGERAPGKGGGQPRSPDLE